jgi:hypothetical protein
MFFCRADPSSFGSSRVSRTILWLLTLVPFAWLVLLVCKYAVPVPFQDQWELVPLLQKSYEGRVTLEDLWAQHNEHRILFPRLLMLLMARLTGWNIGWEIALNVALGAALFGVLTWQIRRTALELALPGLCWAVPAGSLMVFSISHYENWICGWQLQVWLHLLAAVSGIVLLAARPFRWLKFACAGLLGVVATYSFGDGLVFWPVGLVVLVAAAARKKERRIGAALWILMSVLVYCSYAWHYQKPARHPSLASMFQKPFGYGFYVLQYLGALCGMGAPAVMGAAGLALLGWSLWKLRKWKPADRDASLPYVGLILYSFASALVTGVGRVGFGADQALSSRYGAMSITFWISLVVFLLNTANARRGEVTVRPAPECPGTHAGPKGAGAALAASSVVAIVALVALNSLLSGGPMKTLSGLQQFGRSALVELAENPTGRPRTNGLLSLYPRAQIIKERYSVLVRHRLSVFRDTKH